ncbi:RNA polymerase subunit sigma-24, partial [Streptomyces lasiicapitis]
MNEALLRSLTPNVLSILVRRGAVLAADVDAVQVALSEAVRGWATDEARDPRGW